MSEAEASGPSTPPSRRRSRWRRFVQLVVVLALLGGAVVWLLPFSARHRGWYDLLATLSFFGRVFLITTGIAWFALGLICRLSRCRWLALLCLLVGVTWMSPTFFRGGARSHGTGLRIASFNLLRDVKNLEAAVAEMNRFDADVICAQEVTPSHAEQLNAALQLYPHRLVFPDAGYNGMAVFSKMPIELIRAPSGYDDRNLSIHLRAEGFDQPILLVNVHLAPPHRIASRRSNREQVWHLIDGLRTEHGPVILIGDFNFSFATANARQLENAGFNDIASTFTSSATWPTRSSGMLVPPVRIDTAYLRGSLEPAGSVVGNDFGSDHRPILVTVKRGS